MPTYRARLTRFLLKHSVGRKYQKTGPDLAGLRALDAYLIRSQRPPKGTQVTPVMVNGLPAEWIQGPGSGTDAAILFLHGGAFVTGSPATHRELAAWISSSAGVRVLSLDYRLAPEHPFPAAVEDSLAAYRWLQTQGYTPSSIFLGGESSGGGLALQALLSMKRDRVPLPKAAFFLSPVTDWIDLDGESYSTRAGLDPLVSLPQCRFTASLYVGEASRSTALLRPAEMDLAGLPPMWIQVGDHEVLLSDSEQLARRAAEAEVEVDLKVWPGLWHVFQVAARFVPEARDSVQELGRFIRSHLGEGQGLASRPESLVPQGHAELKDLERTQRTIGRVLMIAGALVVTQLVISLFELGPARAGLMALIFGVFILPFAWRWWSVEKDLRFAKADVQEDEVRLLQAHIQKQLSTGEEELVD